MKTRAMRAFKSTFIVATTAAYCLVLSLPFAPRTLGQEAPAADTEPICVAPTQERRPTGSAAHTYTYDCDSGLWQNSYYSWDPATSTAKPKFSPEHRFNADLNRWEVYEWVYNAPQGKYRYEMTSTYAPVAPTNPEPATVENTGSGSSNSLNNSTGSISDTGANSTNNIQGGAGSISHTGTASNNGITLDPQGSTAIDVGVTVGVNTTLTSTAVSGDASVLQNTTAGNATSGDAQAQANIINMIQSTLGWQGLLPEIYTADIQGDYVGDILIDPSSLATGGCTNCGGNVTVNATVDGTIENTVSLLAQSGDATVSANTTAGNATSGNATAVANIVNMINSSIVSGQSFIGVLNIHGNFEGDVLMPEDVINELIAANVPTVNLALCNCGDLDADLTAHFDISNDITASATSGNATVTGNTTAGNATSGSAETHVTVFNLTGRTVIGHNALLVFVNVAGEWIGFITDAPTGATAAMLGSGVTQNSPSSTQADIDVKTNATIRNKVDVTATSGDAEVSNNTQAGNATSGDAYAVANVSNIMGSHFSLSGWFGLLFINVFGDWHGSFGTDTAYGGMAGLPSTITPLPNSNQSSATQGQSTERTRTASTSGAVRTFAVSFSGEASDTTVLATTTELSPEDISQLTEPSFGAPKPASNHTLLIMGGVLLVAYVVIFRPDWLSAILRRH